MSRSAALFGCGSARKGTCANLLNIRHDKLEATILDGLRSQLMDPDAFKAFASAYHSEFNHLLGSVDAEHDATRDEMRRIDRQLERLVEAVLAGGDARTLNAKIARARSTQGDAHGIARRVKTAATTAAPLSG